MQFESVPGQSTVSSVTLKFRDVFGHQSSFNFVAGQEHRAAVKFDEEWLPKGMPGVQVCPGTEVESWHDDTVGTIDVTFRGAPISTALQSALKKADFQETSLSHWEAAENNETAIKLLKQLDPTFEL